MDSLTHFHYRNAYFHIDNSDSLKVTALDMLKKIGFTPLNVNSIFELDSYEIYSIYILVWQVLWFMCD